MDVVKCVEHGERLVDVAHALDLPGSTVRTILLRATKIKASAMTSLPGASLHVVKTRDAKLVKINKLLMGWIKNQARCNIPRSVNDS